MEAISAVRSLMSFRATTPQTDEPTAAMYGELEALMGSALPSVDVRELLRRPLRSLVGALPNGARARHVEPSPLATPRVLAERAKSSRLTNRVLA